MPQINRSLSVSVALSLETNMKPDHKLWSRFDDERSSVLISVRTLAMLTVISRDIPHFMQAEAGRVAYFHVLSN